MCRFTSTDHQDDGAVAVRERERETGSDRRAVLERQREEFGGFSWGADFFG